MATAPFFSLAHPEDSLALINDGQAISYGELARLCDQFAEGLEVPRALIFLSVQNDVSSIVRYLACLRAGHVVHLFSDYDPARLDELISLYNPHYVIHPQDEDGDLKPRHAGPFDLHPAVSVLLSTSGSTGTAKLVKLSQRNLQANAQSICEYLELTSTDRALLNLKFSYSFGLSILHTHLLSGGAIVLSGASITDSDLWAQVEAHKVTGLSGVPYSFEVLERSPYLNNLKTLRYVTQAGGKLSPRLVRHYAELGARQGWKFFVMYGQTEAAPRMTYLPPHMAAQYPECIGVAVPGGRLWLRAEDGTEITTPDTAGELVFEGENVMMGYAESLPDLSRDDTPDFLLTGDITCKNAAGLYYIVGRSKRFVKPMGIRVNLDDVEQRCLKVAGRVVATGNDSLILLVTDSEPDAAALRAYVPELCADLSIAPSGMDVRRVDVIPRLESGKTDYATLKALLPVPQPPQNPIRKIFSRTFLTYFVDEALGLIGLNAQSYRSVQELYAALMGRAVSTDQTFRTLGGDSLSYVQVSIALENFLGHLPDDWDHLPVSQLDSLKLN